VRFLVPATRPGARLLLRNSHPFNLKGDPLTISTSAERYHVFTDMLRDLVANALSCILNDILYEIVPIDIRADIDQRSTRTARFLFDNFRNVCLENIWCTAFQRLFDDLGSVLIHTVLCSVLKNNVKCTFSVLWEPVLDDMLNDPISPLPSSNRINICKNLLKARTLD